MTGSSAKCSPKVARDCQKMMFSAYRIDQYHDPDAFMSQVAIVFAQYDDEVLVLATDPRRRDCIQQTHKFPPTLHEIREALNAAQKAIDAQRYVAARESRGFNWDQVRGGFYNDRGERYVEAKHGGLLALARAATHSVSQ
jgi:hypothetical protein